MAKEGKTLPARRPAPDESLLIRSAESLGRLIGSLQRELDGARKKWSGGETGSMSTNGRPQAAPKAAARTPGAVARTPRARTASARRTSTPRAAGNKPGATREASQANRPTKRASKPAAARKAAGRKRSGAPRRTAKSDRSS